MSSQNELHSVLDFMSHIKVKNLKSSRSHNTTYLGNKDSKHFFVRLYEKYQEFLKNKKSGIILKDSEFITEFSKSLLRVEVAVRKDSIKSYFGTNNIKTILDRWDDTTAKVMWSFFMKDLVKKIGDVSLAPKSDDEILDLLKSRFHRITPKGNISYSTAQNLFNFYLRIVYQGYEVVKQTTSKSTFYDTVRKLESIGLMQTRLQQYEGGTSDHRVIIPFIKIIDLTNCVEPPVPAPSLDFLDQGYLNAIIDLVA
jgi:II/X family phage/plasmid replication protein